MVESDVDDEEEDGEEEAAEASTSSNTIVIYPGSHYLRIGLSSDLAPIEVPHVLARRDGLKVAKEQQSTDGGEEAAADSGNNAALIAGTDALRADLKSILRNMKLRPVANGRQQTANYNASVKPEKLAEHQDVFAVDWTQSKSVKENVILGEKAERLDCFSSGKQQEDEKTWKLFYPFKGGHLNYEEYAKHYGTYACHAAMMNDVITVWSHAISAPKDVEKETASQVIDQGLGIPSSDWQYYKVVLVLPDLFLPAEVESLVNMLIQDMGFAAVLVQQESVCATFGAGLSSGCVIHVGSEQTQICCVDEGLVIPDSRIMLDYGGDHISTYFMHLLQRANFPYQECDLSKRLADRWLADELKERLSTMDPTQLGLVINDFHVRLPDKQTQKFSLRTYDEIIVGPMCLFNPRVITFPTSRRKLLPTSPTSLVSDDENAETESGCLPTTVAMTNCVRHLLPAPPPTAVAVPAIEGSKQTTPVPPASSKPEEPSKMAENQDGEASAAPSARTSPVPATNGGASEAKSVKPINASDAMDVDKGEKPTIDIPYEASKVALDWAVWNSILASVVSCSTQSAIDERMKRMVTNMFCVGGTALMPGLGMAIEARIQNYLSQWFTQQNKDSSTIPNVTVVPPPRDMDPRIVTWKGMAVLARLDSTQDMWVTRNEWRMFQMRALREKAYFM
ncbi:actin-like ATPase domain-containing protein, partial [Meira miltonrushii]